MLKFVVEVWQRGIKIKATKNPVLRSDVLVRRVKHWHACDHKIMQAVFNVYSKMSKSHSWYSKKYSFTSLVRDNLDQEVLQFFEEYEVFAGELPLSDHFKHGAFKVIKWLDQIAEFLPLDRNFYDDEDKVRFIHTMQTIRDLVVFCSLFPGKDEKVWSVGTAAEGDGPARKRARRGEGKTEVDRLPWYFKDFVELEVGVFCELCDSYSGQYKARMGYIDKVNSDGSQLTQKDYGELPLRIKGYSPRFCKDHDPELSHSSYKKASLRRKAFYSLMCIIQEGEKFLYGRVHSHHEEIRKEAFSVVQSCKPKSLQMAEIVVERFYCSSNDSRVEQIVLRSEMIKAYSYYFGYEHVTI